MALTPTTFETRAGILGIATLAVLLIASVAAQMSFGQGFLPHGYCFTWVPGLLWLNVISDVLIAVAYLSIPLTLAYFVRHRTDLPFSWIFILFGVFIVACGTTHALDVWTVWHADYWLLGGVKAITAAASVPTALSLMFLMPKALAIPSARQLQEANDALHTEVARRVVIEQRLEESRAELHKLVAERTSALHKASALLDAFFDSSPHALAVFDGQRRFAKVNPAFAAQTGLPLEHHWGRTFDEVDDTIDPMVTAALKDVRDGTSRVRRFELRKGTDAWRITVYAVPGTRADPLIGYSAEAIA